MTDVNLTREQRIADMSERWRGDCERAGFSPEESITAAAHLMFGLLIDRVDKPERIDVAMRDLADVYITLTQRLLAHFNVRRPPGRKP